MLERILVMVGILRGYFKRSHQYPRTDQTYRLPLETDRDIFHFYSLYSDFPSLNGFTSRNHEHGEKFLQKL